MFKAKLAGFRVLVRTESVLQAFRNALSGASALLAGACVALALACSGAGGGGSTPTPPPPAVTVGPVSPSTPTRTVGSQTTFSAAVSGSTNTAVTWTATGGAFSGPTWTAPSLAGSYTVTATSVADPAKSASTAVTVVAAPTITGFTATPLTITASGTSTLSWSATGATSLRLNPGNIDVTAATSQAVNPSATTTYTLTAANAAGTTATATVTVTLVSATAPIITSFTTSPLTIALGSSSTLAWSYSGGTGVIDNGVGSVASSGTQTVTPTATTTYILTVTNGGGIATTASVTVTVNTLAGTNAYGNVPSGLPPRLAVGLTETSDSTWMASSGVRWDMRYAYFLKAWRNNWGWDPTNSGIWGLEWMQKSDARGLVPVIQYYCLNDYAPADDETAFYAKTQNPAIMAEYFSAFKVLMQRAKEFDKPVLVLLEGDGFGFMEGQTHDNPDAYAAIKDSGMPELAGLPNTAAGWGLAFLQIRRTVGASKVILGVHVSSWASGYAVANVNTNVPLQPEVDKVYAFLSRLGLAPNITGDTFDVMVTDPLDYDADWYWLRRSEHVWWDASDSAPINAASIYSGSFNRYAEWLRLWNVKAGKRWVIWQIPLGNSNHLNIDNDDTTPRSGYKDNRAEYFFGGTTDHLRKFADAGAIALLFGAGNPGQSSHKNDTYTDGQLFMKSRAGAFLNGGGLSISTVSH